MNSEDYQFRWAEMATSRIAGYYLAYCDDSVFIDFNDIYINQIILVRISFDGYGCCTLPQTDVLPMPIEDSITFKSMYNENNIMQEKMKIIIKNTLQDNIRHIWDDALNKYKLI